MLLRKEIIPGDLEDKQPERRSNGTVRCQFCSLIRMEAQSQVSSTSMQTAWAVGSQEILQSSREGTDEAQSSSALMCLERVSFCQLGGSLLRCGSTRKIICSYCKCVIKAVPK